MWKKAFVALLSLNLMVLVGFGLWWSSLPKASDVAPKVQKVEQQDKTATVQLSVDDNAINTYLEYAVSEQAELQRVLSYARVHFSDNWDIQLGIKLRDRVIPSDVVFTPTIHNGDLSLKMDSAVLGQLPVPAKVLFFIFKHLPWPAWITVDADNETLNLNFTQRPQHPYGVQILDYSPSTKQLTLLVSIVPKSLLPHS